MIEVFPATADRFDAVETVMTPRRGIDAPFCWCLGYRLPNAENSALSGADRADRLRRYAEEGRPPGVVAYLDDEPAGWCSVAPRRDHHRLTHSRTIPVVDDVDVWSVVCFLVRPGFRRQGVAAALLDGAIDYAREQGAPMLEGYPADVPAGSRMNVSFAYVGTTHLFEAAGFERVMPTASHSDRLLRWVMRLDLRRAPGDRGQAASN